MYGGTERVTYINGVKELSTNTNNDGLIIFMNLLSQLTYVFSNAGHDFL